MYSIISILSIILMYKLSVDHILPYISHCLRTMISLPDHQTVLRVSPSKVALTLPRLWPCQILAELEQRYH